MIAAFGAISIFGTYSGIEIMGAIANVRDLAPMIAGLIGGPWIGLSVGLIGGVHRFFLGGPTAIACALATILAGLFGGLIYVFNRGKFIGILGAVIFAALMESFHMPSKFIDNQTLCSCFYHSTGSGRSYDTG